MNKLLLKEAEQELLMPKCWQEMGVVLSVRIRGGFGSVPAFLSGGQGKQRTGVWSELGIALGMMGRPFLRILSLILIESSV